MKVSALLSLCLALLVLPAHSQITRQQNTTMHFPPALSTAAGTYELVELMPGIQFDSPVAVASPPGDTRLFVVERYGKVWVINNLDAPTKTLFMDISSEVTASSWQGGIENRRTEGLSSIAFHPNFATNHRFFVTYNTLTTTADGTGHHNRVSEFKANNDNSQAIVSSEIPLITQYDEGPGHNINDLHFGPDGYLYIASGDEGDGGTGDDFNNAQKIDKDYFSAIMRIDVDKKAGNPLPNPHNASNQQAYRIPADNPFVGATSFNGMAVDPQKVRTEFYAVGVRNPWRFSFDPQTSKIFEGDVGQHSREEINEIVKGGNYGWSFYEGTVYGPKFSQMPAGFTSRPPIYEYDTDTYSHPGYSGYSVTCGVVYRGNRIPSLFGNLVFADYVTGNVWTLNVDTQPYPKPTRILGAGQGIAGFGFDPRNGDVLAVHHDSGRILTLQYSSGTPDNVPTTLDQTGIFTDLANLQPQTGIYPYDVNVPLWSDGALKRRWFSISGANKIGFAEDGPWALPTGSVWIKHFDLPLTQGDPSSSVRVETRVLVKTDSSVYGLTYKWANDGSNATLVGDSGDSRGFYVNTPSGVKRQIWRFPSRSECINCHTAAGGRVLGFNTSQMNRDYGYSSGTTNQIMALSNAGFFDSPPAHQHGLRALAPVNDDSASRTYRVRSYLAANCSYCHQPSAGTYAAWDARVTTPTSAASIVLGPLLNTSGTGDKVIYPGSVDHSAILKRMTSTNTDRMPPLGTSVVDAEAVKLINDWVTQELPSFEFYDAWANRLFGGTVPPSDQDADGDGRSNYTEYLLGTNPLQPDAPQSVIAAIDRARATITITQPANRGIVLESTDGFPAANWSILNDPINDQKFPASVLTRTFTDSIGNGTKYYRLRVIEP